MTGPSKMPRITRINPEDTATQRLSAVDHDGSTEQFAVPYPQSAGPEQLPPPIMIRRARPNVFVPPQPQDQGQVISRDVGLQRKIAKPEISRNRKIAGNLPAWDPLPPGEIHVIHRGGGSSQP